VISDTLSAIRTFGRKVEVTAHNVENVDAVGYRKYLSFLKLGKEKASVVDGHKVRTFGPPTTIGKDGGRGECEESPSAKLADRYYHASLQHLDTEDEILGCVLDIIE
jgi:hypothetical protein